MDSNIQIESVYNVAEALINLRRNKGELPDLILLDINMPGMDGFDFLECYQKEWGDHCLPVIMHSSSNDSEERKKSLNYDFVIDYIVKAIRVNDLMMIKNHLYDTSYTCH